MISTSSRREEDLRIYKEEERRWKEVEKVEASEFFFSLSLSLERRNLSWVELELSRNSSFPEEYVQEESV